jgi:hypothetical protein
MCRDLQMGEEKKPKPMKLGDAVKKVGGARGGGDPRFVL